MKRLLHKLSVIVAVFSLLTSVSALADTSTPEAVPPEIATPTDHILKLTVRAKGDQVYECRPVSGTQNKFEWALKEPDADLFDLKDHKIGHHSAGPKWILNAGDKVVGHLHSKAPSPAPNNIPWLRLDVDEASGATLSNTMTIQRVDTSGGLPPSEAADATKVGQIRRSKYTAVYKFYVKKN